MYTLGDTKEMRELLNKSLADAKRHVETCRKNLLESNNRNDRLNLSFHQGEITACEYALKLLDGLDKGTNEVRGSGEGFDDTLYIRPLMGCG